MDKKNSVAIVLLIMLLGFAIRFSFFIGSHFPLHDGGFFYVMIVELIANGFKLPDYSAYNHAEIPFIYPPFGLFFTAVLEVVTGASRLQLMRVIPLVVNTLSIPAFFYLAKTWFDDEWIPLASTLVFALLPMGYRKFHDRS